MVRVSANRGTERHVAEVVEDEEVESSRIISVLAQSNRRDRWTVAPNTSMFTLFARSFFDFRKAEATGKTVEIAVTCLFGKVTLVVPEGTDVQLSGFSFLASATSDVATADEPSSVPKLIVTANTVFGKLCVRTPNDEERGIFPAPAEVDATPADAPVAGPADEVATDATETDEAEYTVPREPVGATA
jgi:hypothetical protein